MTPPVTTEALVDRKALRKAILAAIPENVPLRGRYATAIMEQAVAPLLAAHQQVTAERDAYGEYIIDLECQATRDKAELARLRAEGEAKDRARDDALMALKVYVESGHGGAMCEVREWLRAGAQGPVPFYDGALFRMWAEANGIVSRDGFLARAATAREG